MLIGGRYETIRELGRGGIGKTYLAEDTYRRGRPKCVVKKIQPQMKIPSVLQKAREIFEQEAQRLYELGNHDQIPKLYDHLEQSGEFYLVQELIDGHDLRQAFSLGDRWDEKDVVAQLRDILEILAIVHDHNLIHQDVKPQNLIRRWKDKRLMLIDFGGVKTIRHLAMDAEGTIRVKQPVGTPGYMPKEQTQGNPLFCSDVYAVGMMAIQALTGYSPNQLPRDPDTQQIEWHDQAKVSAELTVILDRMTAPDPAQRYQTARDALEALPAPPPPKALSPEELALFLGEPAAPTYKLVIDPQFEFARDFSEGLAAVVLDGRLGYITAKGEFVIPPKLDFDPISIYREGVYQFSDGLARVAIAHRWGYIDSTGRMVIPPKFDSAENFASGLARVELNHAFGYINKIGSVVIPIEFESAAHAFSEDLAGIEIGHRYGYINRLGRVVIEPQFDSADEFKEGLARITLHDKYGFINKAGKIMIPAEFDVAHTFSEGLARVRVDGKYGYIDPTGAIAIAPQFDDTFSFTGGLALVRNDDTYGFIDRSGTVVISLTFEDAYPFSGGVAAVKVGGLWGYIHPNGAFAIEPQFEDASSFHGDRAAVKINGLWGYLGIIQP